MKKFKHYLLTFLIFLTFLASAFSQKGLTPPQLKEYNNQKLSLDLKGVGVGSYGGGAISYSSWTKWNAFQGFNPIKESELYKIAGYEDLAIQAKKREKRGKTFLWTGIGMAVGGLVIMVATKDSGSPVGITAGAAISLIGIGIGSWGKSINNSNLKPYEVVLGIADEYNLQLNITIKKNF